MKLKISQVLCHILIYPLYRILGKHQCVSNVSLQSESWIHALIIALHSPSRLLNGFMFCQCNMRNHIFVELKFLFNKKKALFLFLLTYI